MKYLMSSYFIFFAGLVAPSFCFSFSLTDSLDVQINRALDEIYNDLYFTNFDSAALAIDQQADRAAQAGRWHMVISALTLKANCAYHHYYADKTYAILLATEALAKKHKAALDKLDPVRVYRSEINYLRGMYFHESGDFSRSIASFDIIIANQRHYHGLDPLYLYYVHSFIGHAALQLMLYDKAYLNYEQGLMWLESVKDYDMAYQYAMANLLKGQCKEYKAKYSGEYNLALEALPLYKKALKLLLPGKEKVSYSGALISAFSRLASLHNFIGQYDSAIYYLNASFKFYLVNDPMRADTYAEFGDVYKKQGQYEIALEFYNRSIAVAEKSYPGKHYRKSIPAFKKAELLFTQKNFQQALSICQEGLVYLVKNLDTLSSASGVPVFTPESNVPLLLQGLALKGRIHFNLYKQLKASEHLNVSLEIYKQSIALIQEAQKKYPDSEYKQNLAARAQSLYEDALESAYYASEKNPDDKAYSSLIFYLLESNKSTMLRDAMNNTHAPQYHGIPVHVLEMESYLKGTITSMRTKLYQNPGDTSAVKWKKDLYAMSQQYDSLVAKIKNDNPVYYEFKYGDQILSLEEVKKNLDAETVLIEYFWGERALYAMATDANRSITRKIPLNATLVNAVTDLLKNITTKLNSDEENLVRFTTLSSSVYEKIMMPLLKEWPGKSIKSLIIISDGMLSYVPFDILLTSPDKPATDFSALPYLLKKYTVRSLFSAAMIRPKPASQSIAYSYVGFAPSYSTKLSKVPFFINNNFNPGELAHNVQEVLDVSANFDGKTFLRNAATEKTFRTMAGNGNVLHLSMHAFTNDQEPSFSALIFTPGDSLVSSNDEDGVLYLHELYDVSLKANLAVLSACETGSGRYARGEGIMSLGRAFCYAGCANIVMSLWKVNDNSTSEIMKVFFKNLKEGMDKDEALRQSKLSFIKTSKNKFFSHPYYWSAFIFTGDPEPIQSFSVFTKGNVMFMGLSIILLSIVILLVVRKGKALQN